MSNIAFRKIVSGTMAIYGLKILIFGHNFFLSEFSLNFHIFHEIKLVLNGFWRKIAFWIICTLYDKNFSTKFLEFHGQIWLQIRNLLKIGRVQMNFSNNSKVSSNLFGYILFFWKVMISYPQIPTKKIMNSPKSSIQIFFFKIFFFFHVRMSHIQNDTFCICQ